MGLQAAHPHDLVEDDRPGPKRGDQQDQEDDLDDDIRVEKQAPDTHVVGGRAIEGEGFDLLIFHELILLHRLDVRFERPTQGHRNTGRTPIAVQAGDPDIEPRQLLSAVPDRLHGGNGSPGQPDQT